MDLTRGFTAFRPTPAFTVLVRREGSQRIADDRSQEKNCDEPLDRIEDRENL